MTQARECSRCGTSLPLRVRHLHELECGDRFRFRLAGDGGPEYVLRSVGEDGKRCGVTGPGVSTVTGRNLEVSVMGASEVFPVLDLEEQLKRSIAERDVPVPEKVLDLMDALKRSRAADG